MASAPGKMLVSAQELADLLGCSVQTIHGHAKSGVLLRVGRGKFELGPSLRGIWQRLAKAATGRGGGASDARTRLYEAQADLVEAKAGALKRELLPVDGVEAHWSSILRAVRAGILALPSRCSIRDPGLSRASIENIDSEARAVLTELAEYDFAPDGPTTGDADADPSAETDTEPMD